MKERDFLSRNHVDRWMRYEDGIERYYYPMLKDWLANSSEATGLPQWSGTAFTSGLGRFMARLAEDYGRLVKAREKKQFKKMIDELWDKADEIKLASYPYEYTRQLLLKKLEELDGN